MKTNINRRERGERREDFKWKDPKKICFFEFCLLNDWPLRSLRALR